MSEQFNDIESKPDYFSAGYTYLQTCFSISYILSRLGIDDTAIEQSAVECVLSKYFICYNLDWIHHYYDAISQDLKAGSQEQLDELNETLGILDETNSKVDFVLVRKILKEVMTALSSVLSSEGVSKNRIALAITETKLFSNLFSEEEILEAINQN